MASLATKRKARHTRLTGSPRARRMLEIAVFERAPRRIEGISVLSICIFLCVVFFARVLA